MIRLIKKKKVSSVSWNRCWRKCENIMRMMNKRVECQNWLGKRKRIRDRTMSLQHPYPFPPTCDADDRYVLQRHSRFILVNSLREKNQASIQFSPSSNLDRYPTSGPTISLSLSHSTHRWWWCWCPRRRERVIRIGVVVTKISTHTQSADSFICKYWINQIPVVEIESLCLDLVQLFLGKPPSKSE